MISHQLVTYGGDYVSLVLPAFSDFTLVDIAHSLAHQCRFNGHVREYYSVAQHSIHVSHLVPDNLAWPALMHDAAEAFIGDVPTPLKILIPEIKRQEQRIMRAIELRFSVPPQNHPAIKHADRVALATERRDLISEQATPWPELHGITPARRTLKPLTPENAKAAFVQRALDVMPYNTPTGDITT